jgi:hypothetical protein
MSVEELTTTNGIEIETFFFETFFFKVYPFWLNKMMRDFSKTVGDGIR